MRAPPFACFLIALAIATPQTAAAQAAPATSEQIVAQEIRQAERRRFVTVNVENDMFGGGTDENYTSGVRATYHEIGADLPWFSDFLDDIVPTFRRTEATGVYYSIGQNLYTPANIQTPLAQPNDRPWAAYLYASAGLVAVRGNRVDEIEASLGIVGPAALGKQTQRLIHKWVDSPKPRGWQHQLKNEPALLLSWNRRFPGYHKTQLPQLLGQRLALSLEPNIGASLGNVYTYASTGLGFRLGPDEGFLQDTPIKVRPAMPGTGAFVIPDGTLSWQIFGGVEGRAVARNIFLDGNTFADSHSVDKKPFVYDATLGIATAYGPARVSYAVVYRSREFDKQKNSSLFGTISAGYRF